MGGGGIVSAADHPSKACKPQTIVEKDTEPMFVALMDLADEIGMPMRPTLSPEGSPKTEIISNKSVP